MKRNNLFGYLGVLAPLVVFTIVTVSIALSPGFSLTGNLLSDLGVNGLSSAIFNSGLVVAGVLGIAFGAAYSRKSPVGYPIIVSAAFLAGIGLFPETAGPIHSHLSIAFFVLMALSMLFAGVLEKKPAGYMLFILAAVSVLPWAVAAWLGASAVSQVVSYTCFGAFFIFMGYRMLEE